MLNKVKIINSMNMKMSRRNFLAISGSMVGTSIIEPIAKINALNDKFIDKRIKKKQIALVGTGSRGSTMWGKDLKENFNDYVEFVGLCDTNYGRLQKCRELMGVNCQIYTDFEKMMYETKPDILIVTTPDNTHDKYIIRGMELGADIITEKPMTTDEKKIEAILDAERRTNKKCTVTFNYRYSPHRTKIWEILRNGEIGKITSVDFNYYLDTTHGADYFRRWHRLAENSGTLWVHKASHHFDLLNWWIDSDPESVYALGELNFYGKNGSFRGINCRNCEFKEKCDFYFNINDWQILIELFVENEKYDGYFRDGCIFRNDVDIFDKMNASIRYKNGVQVSYSLTTYSPYEGYRIAFNGTGGRLEAWIQESNRTNDTNYDELVLYKIFSKRQYIQIPFAVSDHGGGDILLKQHLFIPGTVDTYKQSANIRDGALACLLGIAARKSIQLKKPINIGDLTSIQLKSS